MKRSYWNAMAMLVAFGLSAQLSWAGEVVKWTGIVQEEGGYHTPKHDRDHEIEFVRQGDNDTFDVVDSPELTKLHAEKDKKLLVEIDGEKTSRFLFWGGNLVVKNFKVLQALDEIPHREPARTVSEKTGRGDFK